MASNLAKKREQFHSKIRSQYLQNYMKKIRYELIQQQVNSQLQTLNNLIEQTSSQINQQQLKYLLKCVQHDDLNNAIIHLGNLLIDNIVSLDYLIVNYKLQPKNSQYWLWLIKVILTLLPNPNQSQYQQYYLQWQQTSIQYVLNRLVTVQQTFSLIQCLEIVKLIFQKQKQKIIQSLIINYQGVFIKIKDLSLHFDKKVSQLSYQIIDHIIELGDQYTIELIKICSLLEIQRVLISGFNKLDSTQKKFPLIICRIINNIYASKINMSQNIIKACINTCLNPQNTERVKVEFSYLWLSFSESCTMESLRYALQQKLLHVFQTLLLGVENINNNKCMKIVENVYKSLREIQQKMKGLDQNQILQISSNISYLISECQLIRRSLLDKEKQKINNSSQNYRNKYKQQEIIQHTNKQQIIITGIQTLNQSQMDIQ